MVAKIYLIIFATCVALVSCYPGSYPPEHVYRDFAWHYVGTLIGNTVGPIVPPVKKIAFYKTSKENMWPTIKQIFDEMQPIYETDDKDEIDFLLSAFNEDLPQDYPWGKPRDVYYGMHIHFSTLETLYIPFELYGSIAILETVDYCTEIQSLRSAKALHFLKEKGIFKAGE